MFLEISQNWGLQLYKKRDSGTGVFLWILWNFQEHLFYRTPLGDCSEAANRGVLWKKVFLEISQNSQENGCARVSFLIKLQASGDSGIGVFLWILRNFSEHLFHRTPLSHCFWLLLKLLQFQDFRKNYDFKWFHLKQLGFYSIVIKTD